MVNKLLGSILGISFLFNIIQYTLLDNCKIKIKVQNEMVSIANQQRDAAIKLRDKEAIALAKRYNDKLEAIKDKKLQEGDYTCEQSLDLIITAMREISNAPDNPDNP